MAKKLKYIIIHCTDSNFGDVDIIRQWHVGERGWRDVGYHAVILNGHRKPKSEYKTKEDGLIEAGRGFNIDALVDEEERGAHALGYNSISMGVALVGRDKFTVNQFKSALKLCSFYQAVVPGIKVIGHCETPKTDKTCPNFSMDRFRMLLKDENYLEPWMVEKVLSDYIKEDL
jgi:hypothetical protein